MHNRALHDSLAAFVEEAAWQLAEEVSGGAEIPFELDATPTRSRAAVLLPAADRALHRPAGRDARPAALVPAGGAGPRGAARPARATCASRGRRVPAGDARAAPTPRCRRSSARSGATPPTSSSTPSASRPPTPSSRRSPTPAARSRSCSTPVEGLVIESDEVPLGEGLALVRGDDARRRARRPRRRPARDRRVLALESKRRRPRARAAGRAPAPPADRAAPVGRRRARARPDRLGAHRRQRLDGDPARHRPAPPERATACSRAEEEDPLRAFCGLVARRTPRAGELAWALRRFELGCERASAVEALTDWLLAARALFAEPTAPATTAWPSGSPRSAPSRTTAPALEARVARGDLARARGDGRLRAAGAGGRRARVASSAAACARCCATCSAATSTRRCAGSPTSAAETDAAASATRGSATRQPRGPRRRGRRPSSSGTTIVGGSPSSARRRSTSPASRAAERRRARAPRRHAPGQRRRRAPPASARRAAAVVGRLVHAVDDEAAERHPRLAQLAVEEDRLLDRVVARRGDDQERRRRVLRAARRRAAARSVKPSIIPPSARKNTDRSRSRSTPVTRCSSLKTTPGAAAEHRREPGRAQEHADRAALEEARSAAPGASRKSSALRDGGVSRTSTSKPPAWSSS